jgi:hypothetical protein
LANKQSKKAHLSDTPSSDGDSLRGAATRCTGGAPARRPLRSSRAGQSWGTCL